MLGFIPYSFGFVTRFIDSSSPTMLSKTIAKTGARGLRHLFFFACCHGNKTRAFFISRNRNKNIIFGYFRRFHGHCCSQYFSVKSKCEGVLLQSLVKSAKIEYIHYIICICMRCECQQLMQLRKFGTSQSIGW